MKTSSYPTPSLPPCCPCCSRPPCKPWPCPSCCAGELGLLAILWWGEGVGEGAVVGGGKGVEAGTLCGEGVVEAGPWGEELGEEALLIERVRGAAPWTWGLVEAGPWGEAGSPQCFLTLCGPPSVI